VVSGDVHETEGPQSAGEKAATRSKELRRLILTAVLFGFGVNLLSDFIFDLPTHYGNPWSLLMLALSVVTTVAVSMLFVMEYMTESSRLSAEFTSILTWDPTDGKLVRLNPAYVPQVIAPFLLSRIDKAESDAVVQAMTGDYKNLSSFEVYPVRQLFQRTLSYALGDPEFFKKNPPPHTVNSILFGGNQVPFEADLSQVVKKLPSVSPLRWHEKAGKGLLCNSWKHRLVGHVTFTVSADVKNADSPQEIMEQVDFLSIIPKMDISWLGPSPPNSRLIIAEFKVRAEAHFSRLLLNLRSTRAVLSGVDDIFLTLRQMWGWQEVRTRVIQIKQLKDALRQTHIRF